MNMRTITSLITLHCCLGEGQSLGGLLRLGLSQRIFNNRDSEEKFRERVVSDESTPTCGRSVHSCPLAPSSFEVASGLNSREFAR